MHRSIFGPPAGGVRGDDVLGESKGSPSGELSRCEFS